MAKNKESGFITLRNTALWLLIICLLTAFLLYFRSIVIPFIYALVISYLIHELVNWTGRLKIAGRPVPHLLRNIIVFLIIIGVIYSVVEIISANVRQIVAKAPEYEQSLDRLIAQVGDLVKAEDFSTDIQEKLEAIDTEAVLSKIVNSLSSFLGNFFLVIIFIIFMLLEFNIIPEKLDHIFVNKRQRKNVQMLLDRIDHSIRQYLSVKTLISLGTGLCSYAILLFFKVDFPVLWAFLIFLLNFIPYVGSLLGTLLPTFMAIFQFESVGMGLKVFLCIQVIQTIFASFVEPRVTGKTLNLSPVVVLLALSFWGVIWGVAGMIISVPITAMLVIVMAQFPNTRSMAVIMSERGSVLAITEEEED